MSRIGDFISSALARKQINCQADITGFGQTASNFVTKIGSGWMHIRKGTVRKRVVLALGAGSVPGSVLGVSLLVYLRSIYGTGVNKFITVAVGILLVCVPTLLLFQSRIEEHVTHRPPTMKSFVGMSVIGLLAGFLVGMTSVGSGSIIMMLLLLFSLSAILFALGIVGSYVWRTYENSKGRPLFVPLSHETFEGEGSD